MSSTPNLVQRPNRFEEDLGHLSERKKEEIVTVLRGFMAEARALVEQAGKFTRRFSPEREATCHTCAFNPVCDDLKGFAPTSYGLLWTILNDKVFTCHSNQSGWKQGLINPDTLELCNGFYAVRLFSGSQEVDLARRTMEAIQAIVSRPVSS